MVDAKVRPTDSDFASGRTNFKNYLNLVVSRLNCGSYQMAAVVQWSSIGDCGNFFKNLANQKVCGASESSTFQRSSQKKLQLSSDLGSNPNRGPNPKILNNTRDINYQSRQPGLCASSRLLLRLEVMQARLYGCAAAYFEGGLAHHRHHFH